MPTMQMTGDPIRELVYQLRQASDLIRQISLQQEDLFNSILEQIDTNLPANTLSSQSSVFRVILERLAANTGKFVVEATQLANYYGQVSDQFNAMDQALRSGDLVGDPESPEMPPTNFEQINVDVYLDTEDEEIANEVFAAIGALANAIGIYDILPSETEHGSILRRSKAMAASVFADKSVQQRLQTLERLLELWQVDPRQAEVDQRTSDALSRMISSLENVPRACIRFGSLLIVKYQDESGSVLLSRQLSQPEIWAFEKYPELQSRPETIFDSLALAASGQLEPATGSAGDA
jgi:hypothetical protein